MLARAVGNMALGRLANPGTALFVCDIQERFRTVITGFPSVIDTSKRMVLLVGIETHVCVLQTAIDLMESGYEVHIVVDGVSSQRVSDRSVALQRLSQSGALFTTSESAMFQLVGDAKHPDFKAISALVKEERPEPLQSML